MLMRKTSAPASKSAFIFSGVDDAGPSVASIFVFRRLRIGISRSVGERLRPVGCFAGVDLEEPFAVVSPVRAPPASDDRELSGAGAEFLAAVPGPRPAVRRVEVVVARVE